MQAETGGKRWLCCSGTNGLSISWLRFFDTRREIQFLKVFANHTIWPTNARRILRCLRFLSVEIRKTQLHLQWSKSNPQLFNSMAESPTTRLHGSTSTLTVWLSGGETNCLPPWSNVNFQLTLFQNPQILRAISSGHDVILTPAPFPVWGFVMTMVIVISFARERKTVPNDYAPELFTQIVQSPTKLYDKI